jgi:hypothetical protein
MNSTFLLLWVDINFKYNNLHHDTYEKVSHKFNGYSFPYLWSELRLKLDTQIHHETNQC